ncbi:hypothetical protein SBA2_260034 [Acidobacteriia bacterium SbA2]|nr:hypothetical protein SBA2_260034 [Acidobacteriia bacterium SbA2]
MLVKWRTHYRLGSVLYLTRRRYKWKSGPSRAAGDVGYQLGFSPCGRLASCAGEIIHRG